MLNFFITSHFSAFYIQKALDLTVTAPKTSIQMFMNNYIFLAKLEWSYFKRGAMIDNFYYSLDKFFSQQ